MKSRIVSRRGAAWRLDVQTGAGSRAGLCSSTSRLALIALLGAGASSLAFSASAANFNANNASDLANAINRAANGDTITFTSNITLGSNLLRLRKASRSKATAKRCLAEVSTKISTVASS